MNTPTADRADRSDHWSGGDEPIPIRHSTVTGAMSQPPQPDTRQRRRGRGPLARRDALIGTGLVVPTIVVILLVVGAPFAWTVLLAFQRIRLIDIPTLSVFNAEYTLDNFRETFRDPDFWRVAWTTVVYSVLGTLLSLGLGLVAAFAFRRPFPGRAVARAVLLAPYVIPVVAATTTWRALLNPQFGFINAVGTRFLGWDRPIPFLSTHRQEVELGPVTVGIPVALLIVILFEAWRSFPLAFLFITARLAAVPAELEEAAVVDGASAWQRFRLVLLPQLAGVLALLAFLRFVWTFQNFNDVYLLTGGAGGTDILPITVYQDLVVRNDIGTASALGLVMASFLLLCTIGYLRLTRRSYS